MLLKVMQVFIMLEFLIFLTLNYNLDTDSAIKRKLVELLAQLRGFKFLTTLVFVFKKIESKDKTNSSSKAEKMINESGIENVFNQSMLPL